MTTLIASDLDRTMIYSRSAAGGPTAGLDDLVCVEHYDGRPLSFMTSSAATLLGRLSDTATFVPTTTRTIEQYRRIALPGGPHRYAVTSNGGNILVDSEPDLRWRARVDARIRHSGPPLHEVTTELARRIDESWVRNFRIAEGLFCYLVVNLSALPTTFLDEWTQWAAKRNWKVSIQGRKIYTVPEALCKSAAVSELRDLVQVQSRRRGSVTVLAAGDGALDAEMLRQADRGIRPRHGELEATNFQSADVAVTVASGAAAGEEIVRWMLGNVATHARART